MKVQLLGLEESLLSAAKELQELLHFEVTADGTPITFEKIAEGISVDVGAQKIGYSKMNELFRGLFYYLANMNNKSYSKKEVCSFEEFTIMSDNSRNAVHNVETVKDLIRYQAVLGYNQLMLYTEDTYEVENEPYFGYLRGRFTAVEIKELDAYASSFGIELVPCIQTLAHINQITRYTEYGPIIDINDILLCEEERTYQLIENMFKTLHNNFTSRKVNIGMDESFMLGLGKYLNKHGYQKRFEIMMKHLNCVNEIAKKYDFKCKMWSDMFFHLIFDGKGHDDLDKIDKEILDLVPQDIELLYWDYYSAKVEKYQNNLKKHFKISNNIGFAGGAWKWNGYAANNTFTILSTNASIEACKEYNIKDLIITSWGDDGAEASIFMLLPSFFHIAHMAYNSELPTQFEEFKYLTTISFEDYRKLDLPNKIVTEDRYDPTLCNNPSKIFLYSDLLHCTFNNLIEKGMRDIYKAHIESISSIDTSGFKYGYHFDNMKALMEILAIKIELTLEIREAYEKKDMDGLRKASASIKELIGCVDVFATGIIKFWETENKLFGLEILTYRLYGLMGRLKHIDSLITRYSNGEISKIDELEEKVLPFGYQNQTDITKVAMDKANIIMTTAVYSH